MTELLSTDDAARIVSLSAYTIRAAIRDGELRATKLRGRIRIHPDDLAAWVDAGRVHVLRPARQGRPVPVTPRRCAVVDGTLDPRAAVRALRRKDAA